MKEGCDLLPNESYVRRCAVALGLEWVEIPGGPLVTGDRADGDVEDLAPALTEGGGAVSVSDGGRRVAVFGAGQARLRVCCEDVCQEVARPTTLSMQRLRRVVRYLWSTRDYGIFIPKGGGIDKLVVFADADWADQMWSGDRRGHCAALQTRSQKTVALSSGDSEVYAMASAASEGLHVQQLWAWFGYPMRLRLRTDSSATREVVHRQGVGRIRHLSVKVLWIPEYTAKGRILVEKVLGTQNPTGGGTKPLAGKSFEEFQARSSSGRSTAIWFQQYFRTLRFSVAMQMQLQWLRASVVCLCNGHQKVGHAV